MMVPSNIESYDLPSLNVKIPEKLLSIRILDKETIEIK